jgi:hypothetical protein
MTPVHLLSIEDAQMELEGLLDIRPGEDQPLDLHNWTQKNGPRVKELEVWILMHQQPTPAPTVEPTVTAIKASPEEQLDTLLAKLSNATGDCCTALNRHAFMAARSRVYLHRNAIKRLVAHHDLEAPSLPEIPTNPFAFGSHAEPAPKAGKQRPEPMESQRATPLTKADPRPAESLEFDALKAEFLSTGRAIQGLAVLMAPWGNPAIVGKLNHQAITAVAELTAILGQHVEHVGQAIA